VCSERFCRMGLLSGRVGDGAWMSRETHKSTKGVENIGNSSPTTSKLLLLHLCFTFPSSFVRLLYGGKEQRKNGNQKIILCTSLQPFRNKIFNIWYDSNSPIRQTLGTDMKGREIMWSVLCLNCTR
jgi:hypothetical protein